jgi:predicted lipoprotein with Yx(FWY)xxD motif
VTPQIVQVAAQAAAEAVDDHTFRLVPVRIDATGCDADVYSLKAEVTALAANVYKLINKARLCTGAAPIPAVTFQEPPANVPAAPAATDAAPITQAAPSTEGAATTQAAPATQAATTQAAATQAAATQAAATTQAATEAATTTARPTTTTTTAAATPTPTTQPANRYKKSAKTGFITDANGNTCYTNGASSVTCTDASGCGPFWPPCIASAKDSALPGTIGTVLGNGNKKYGTYKGMVLYRFANDNGPDDTQGDGSNGFSGCRP